MRYHCRLALVHVITYITAKREKWLIELKNGLMLNRDFVKIQKLPSLPVDENEASNSALLHANKPE